MPSDGSYRLDHKIKIKTAELMQQLLPELTLN
jgi:hypothetical protein